MDAHERVEREIQIALLLRGHESDTTPYCELRAWAESILDQAGFDAGLTYHLRAKAIADMEFDDRLHAWLADGSVQ